MNKKLLPNGVISALDTLRSPVSPWIKTPQERAEMTIACRDADVIPRVKNAGEVINVSGKNVQVMHNGLLVLKDGYQGEWETRVIGQLKGVHEPQEEKVFHEVLKRVDSGSTMLELGSWWSYYSMWFLKQIPKAKAYCTEPDLDNVTLGKANAKINGFTEDKNIFFRQYASGIPDGSNIKFTTEKGVEVTVPVRTVDSIIEQENIKKLEILHFDIQGAELETLKGAERAIKGKKIRFIFISTHHYSISDNPNIHQECISFIKKHGGHVIASHTVFESCSGDGLIVASFDDQDKSFSVSITRQPTDNSLFRSPELDTLMLARAFDDRQRIIIKKDKEINQLQQQVIGLQKNLENEIEKVYRLEYEINEITPLRKHVKKSVKSKFSKS